MNPREDNAPFLRGFLQSTFCAIVVTYCWSGNGGSLDGVVFVRLVVVLLYSLVVRLARSFARFLPSFFGEETRHCPFCWEGYWFWLAVVSSLLPLDCRGAATSLYLVSFFRVMYLRKLIPLPRFVSGAGHYSLMPDRSGPHGSRAVLDSSCSTGLSTILPSPL